MGQFVFTETVENVYDYSDSASRQKVTFNGKKYPTISKVIEMPYKHPCSIYSLHMYMGYGTCVCACMLAHTHTHTHTHTALLKIIWIINK